jgi:pyruvate, water dikinase
MKNSILYFDEIGLQDVVSVGGKNATLGEVFRQLGPKGILVPDGFATTAKVYREFIKQNYLEQKIARVLSELKTFDFSNLPEIGHTVRSLVQKSFFPYHTQVQIIAAYYELVERVENDGHVVVRSSAVVASDSLHTTFENQLGSYLHVKGENALLEACKNCYVSLFTDKAIKDSVIKKINLSAIAISVGVQQMIRPYKDGAPVSFTLNQEEQDMISQWSVLIEDHFQMPIYIFPFLFLLRG